MKSKPNNQKEPSISGPLLRDMLKNQKKNLKAVMAEPTIGSQPLAQPDLYQDPGSGYNANFTFPQD
jgi:hypothetical protein